MSALHLPTEVHSVSRDPIKVKPTSHVMLHQEPKLNSSWGSEQFRTPWEGELKVGHLLAGREQREGETVLQLNLNLLMKRAENSSFFFLIPKQWGRSALHMPTEVHSVSAVPFSTKPSSQVMLHWEPKLNSAWGSEHSNRPCRGALRAGHLLATERETKAIHN